MGLGTARGRAAPTAAPRSFQPLIAAKEPPMTTLSQSDLAPDYDRSRITTGIVHMGVGGFHRAHQATGLGDLRRGPDAAGHAHA